MKSCTMMSLVLGCSIVLLALAQVSAAGSLTLQVEPKTKECFYEEFKQGKQVKYGWAVVRGGLLDILIQVNFLSANGQPTAVFEKMHFENEGEGEHEFTAQESGIYQFCFNNEMARFTAKVITFSMISSSEWGVKDDDDEDVIDPMEKAARRISEEMDVLQLHQQYMRQREVRHRITAQSTNSRVLWMSVVESIVLISLSIVQVYYIKKQFE